MEKGEAGKWVVFAYGLPDHANPGQAITGDAANITANIRIDGGAANAVDDVNPAELEDGYYIFDITGVESTGDLLSLHPVSATANVQVIGVPGAVWTRPANFNAMGIETDGDLTQVNSLTGHTVQTGDTYALANGANGFVAVKAETASILADTNELQTDDIPTTLATLATASALTTVDNEIATMQGNVTDILTDTSTSIPATITTINLLLDSEIADIKAVTDAIGATGTGLSAIPWNASWDAEVQSECADALTAYDPPTNTEMTTAFTEIKGATWASGTDTLEAIRDRGDTAWTTGAGGTPPGLLQSTTIATLATQTSFTLTAGSADDDVYNDQIVIVTDQATATQKAVGTVSDYTGASKTVTLSADPGIFTMAVGDSIDIVAATGAAGSGATASEVWTYGTRVLTAGTNLNDPTAAVIADAVWDEAQADHVSVGTFGVTASEIADVLADTNELQTDDIPTTLATLATASALTTVDNEIATMQGNVTDILADTGELQADWANGGRLDLIIDLILADTGELQADWANGGRLDLIIDAIVADTGTDGVAISATVANEIADAILNRDFTSVSDTNARTALNALRFLRNKYSISGTTLTVTKEDDTTEAWTSTLTTNASADPVTGSDPV